jgi:hypothetical protein
MATEDLRELVVCCAMGGTTGVRWPSSNARFESVQKNYVHAARISARKSLNSLR